MRSTTANPNKLVFTVLLFAVIIIVQLCLIIFFESERKIVDHNAYPNKTGFLILG